VRGVDGGYNKDCTAYLLSVDRHHAVLMNTYSHAPRTPAARADGVHSALPSPTREVQEQFLISQTDVLICLRLPNTGQCSSQPGMLVFFYKRQDVTLLMIELHCLSMLHIMEENAELSFLSRSIHTNNTNTKSSYRDHYSGV